MNTLHVDCASCVARPSACGDCVISVLLGHPDEVAPPVELEADERSALAALASSGLVPPLRLVEGGGERPGPVRRRA